MLKLDARQQLFLDDRFFDSATGIRRVMNNPVQHPDPVLTADKPWEAARIGGYNTVLREADGRFRLWYHALLKPGLPQEGAGRLAYAESQDGLHWTKPELGLVPFQGSTANNIVAPLLERQSQQGATVLHDPRAPAAERYKLLTKFRATDDDLAAGAENGLYAMHSPDGLRWTLYPDQPCSPVMCDTQNIAFYDDSLNLYVAYTRVAETQHVSEAAKSTGRRGYRAVGRITSPDFRAWSAQRIVFEADAEDLAIPVPGAALPGLPRVDFYTSCAMKLDGAQDAYLMFPSAYYHWADHDFPATMDIQMLASRDGIRWDRQGGRAPFLRRGPEGSGRSGMLFANPNPVPVGDELWFYYSGTDRRHAADSGAPLKSGIFRATLRRDGFLSADAGYGGGSFTTPPFTFTGDTLEFNLDAAAGGWLAAELLDGEGRPYPGFSLTDAVPLHVNSVRAYADWRNKPALAALAGRPVRLHIAMRDAKLYAFRFAPTTQA